MATIGLKDLHYALLISDPVAGTPTYQTPVAIKNAISANVNPNSSSATLFADDGPADSAATMGEISLELNMADLPLPVQAVLLGATYANGLLIQKGDDTPPWVAIGYKTLKSNGSYRYMWLAKGKFALPEEQNKTKGDSVEFQTPTIKGSFVKRDCDGEWKRAADEDDDDFTADIATNWYAGPVSMLTLSPAPSITATWAGGVATGSTKATITGNPAAGNHYAYIIASETGITPMVGTRVDGAYAYTSAADIPAVTAGKVVKLYELNGYNKVIKYVAKVLTSGDIT